MVPTHEAVAIERFALNSTIPIIYEHNDKSIPRGTGTLFEIKGKFFVITARHIFYHEGISLDKEKFAFPENPIKGGIYTFGVHDLHLPQEEHIDIAIIEIKDEKTIEKLKTGWTFLDISQVSNPSANSIFFVSGYPDSLITRTQGWLYGKFVTAYTTRMHDIPEPAAQREKVIPGLDLFFHYGHDATTLDGKSLKTPELPGVSGASVWEYRHLDSSSVWTPEKSVKIIGVQSAYVHSSYIRVKSWHAVASALDIIDKGLSKTLKEKLKDAE